MKKLAPFIPSTGSVGNPVDLTFAKDYSSFFSEIPGILLAEENADILMIYLLRPAPGGGKGAERAWDCPMKRSRFR